MAWKDWFRGRLSENSNPNEIIPIDNSPMGKYVRPDDNTCPICNRVTNWHDYINSNIAHVYIPDYSQVLAGNSNNKDDTQLISYHKICYDAQFNKGKL